ncbi:MAG: N-acetylmuramoyl-L-alanine amidase [Paracoccaceae bacterium]
MRSHPSPNFGERKGGAVPELIVLHYTAMADLQETLARICDPLTEVSAHYLISKTGLIYGLVDEAKRAWHAGQGQWAGRGDVNSRSIGIELENSGAEPFAALQMQALADLLINLEMRLQIPPHGVIGHSDMSPQRKSDPGKHFDWRALALQGVSVWPALNLSPVPVSLFAPAARAFGYSEGTDAQVLTAFRLRFCPHVTGLLSSQDAALAHDLARRFGVDANCKQA